MGSTATITQKSLRVQPGGRVETELRLHNTGKIVDQFTFQTLGDAAGWVTFEPATLSLYPDSDGTTRIVVLPPTGPEAKAGNIPVGVRIVSREDPAGTRVEEFDLDVGHLVDVSAEIVPRTSRGSRRAVVHVAVDNRGNSRVNADLDAVNPDNALGFAFNPPAIVAEPGTAAFSRLVVAPRRRFLRGPTISHAFTVQVQPDGEAPVTAEGTLVQEAVIPRWLPRAVLAALGVAALVALMTFGLVRPSVKSAAQEAARDEVTPALQQASEQIGKLAEAMGQPRPAPLETGGGGGGGSGGGGGGGGGGGSGSTTEEEAAEEAGEPFDRRLAATADEQSPSFTIPDDKIFRLSDLVLQNPEGDSGLVRIRRGDDDLFVVRLENFRDLDYHFVAPIFLKAGEKLNLAVNCQNPPETQKPCTPAVLVSGSMVAEED